jgi:hypothetical protein
MAKFYSVIGYAIQEEVAYWKLETIPKVGSEPEV